MKLGAIIDLLVSVRTVALMLEIDSTSSVDEICASLVKITEDRKSLIKFMRVIRVANKSAKLIEDAPMSFFGGQLPQVEDIEDLVDDPVDDIPKRARESSESKGEVRRPKGYGKKEE